MDINNSNNINNTIMYDSKELLEEDIRLYRTMDGVRKKNEEEADIDKIIITRAMDDEFLEKPEEINAKIDKTTYDTNNLLGLKKEQKINNDTMDNDVELLSHGVETETDVLLDTKEEEIKENYDSKRLLDEWLQSLESRTSYFWLHYIDINNNKKSCKNMNTLVRTSSTPSSPDSGCSSTSSESSSFCSSFESVDNSGNI